MGRENRVAIVVDSAASLPAGAETDPQLYVVPMRVTIEGRTYLDGRDLAPSTFYRMQKGMKGMPTTSAPSPASFLDSFRAAAESASSILCLTVSPRFSSSYDSAGTAVQEAKEAVPLARIAVLDTESAAGGEGLIAMEEWRAAHHGAGLEEVTEAARSIISKVSLLAFLDTLYYVWKGGRVPRLAYASTSILRIKPLWELYRGEIRNMARPRTTLRATKRLLRLMRQRVGHESVHAAVLHADAAEAAEQLRQTVDSEFQCEELFTSEFSPVMGAHTGPGLLGIAFWSENGTE